MRISAAKERQEEIQLRQPVARIRAAFFPSDWAHARVEVLSLAPGFSRVASAHLGDNGFNRFLDRQIGKPLKRLTRGAR